MSTPADEKAAVPELSENEKKLAAEIESLNKDIENYKEKCSDLDVCKAIFHLYLLLLAHAVLIIFVIRISTNDH